MITKNPNQYKSKPLKRVMIPKSNSTELRPLGIPTLMDRAVQAVYHLGVDPAVEAKSDPNSFGFRKGRSQHDAIAYIRSRLNKTVSPEWILETDIAKCFDKINHDFLLKKTPICHKQVLKEWLKSGYVFEGRYTNTDEGTPQGGIISPTLCNVALNGIETVIMKRYPYSQATFIKIGHNVWKSMMNWVGPTEKTSPPIDRTSQCEIHRPRKNLIQPQMGVGN